MLEATDVHKRFGSVLALDGASLRIVPGRVRALVGGNGSGKSTFAKILTGIVAPDRIRLTVDDAQIDHRGPATAGRLRVGATYQEVALANDLSVAENLDLKRMSRRWGVLYSSRWTAGRSLTALERVSLPASVLHRKVRELSLDQRALAELAKLLLDEPRFAILDELTASLRREQVDRVGELLRELTAEGVGVLYVSHRLEEIDEFCDAATVLRNGRTVLNEDSLREHSLDDLIAAITGGEPGSTTGTRPHRTAASTASETILEVTDLSVPGYDAKVSLHCAAGEIVGIAGLSGNGQSEVLRALFSARQADGGTIRLRSEELQVRTVRHAVLSGIGFLSGEREREMAFENRSVGENLTAVANTTRSDLSAEELLERLQVPQTHRRAAMHGLSGGNQQKIIVGRWLGLKPAVLLADDATRGVDVTTRAEIHGLLRELADSGSAVLLTSSDDRELAEICDRVYVLYRGAIVSRLSGDEINPQAIGLASVQPSIEMIA